MNPFGTKFLSHVDLIKPLLEDQKKPIQQTQLTEKQPEKQTSEETKTKTQTSDRKRTRKNPVDQKKKKKKAMPDTFI